MVHCFAIAQSAAGDQLMEQLLQVAERVGIGAAFSLGLLTLIGLFLKAMLPLLKDWLVASTEFIKTATAAQEASLQLHQKNHEELKRLGQAHLAGAELIDALESMMTQSDRAKAHPYLQSAKRALRGN
jgi:hypothetical protein